MTKAEEILNKYPSVKLGLDDHYGRQTVLNMLNEALNLFDVIKHEAVVCCDTCKHNCLIWDDNHPCVSCAEFDNFEQKTTL